MADLMRDGEVHWLIKHDGDHLVGTLWNGPPTSGDGEAVLVIPLKNVCSQCADERPHYHRATPDGELVY